MTDAPSIVPQEITKPRRREEADTREHCRRTDVRSSCHGRSSGCTSAYREMQLGARYRREDFGHLKVRKPLGWMASWSSRPNSMQHCLRLSKA